MNYSSIKIGFGDDLIMKIAIGCDHGGFELKNEIIQFLKDEKHEVKDFGTYSTGSCDYPDIALPVAEAVAAKEYEFGILICGTGIGISIAANKVPGIRAALCSDTFSAHATREHNNANILTMGQRVVGAGLALDIVRTFITSKFEGDRHQKRIDKISEIEKKYTH
jgi:ribose 5-phosphate isomerase B